jgi:hypothetical protein
MGVSAPRIPGRLGGDSTIEGRTARGAVNTTPKAFGVRTASGATSLPGGWIQPVVSALKKLLFRPKNASGLIFRPGFLQLFAGQNDRPEIRHRRGAKFFAQGENFSGGIYRGVAEKIMKEEL